MAAGTWVLGVYALLEIWFRDLVPALLGWVDPYTAHEDPKVLFFLLLGYLAAGALLGLASAALITALNQRAVAPERVDLFCSAVVSILLLDAFAANLLAQYEIRLWTLLVVGFSFVGVVLLCSRLFLERAPAVLAVLTNPWMIWLILLGSSSGLFHQRDSGERLPKIAGLVAFLCVAAAMIYSARRWKLQLARSWLGLAIALSGTFLLGTVPGRMAPWFPSIPDRVAGGSKTPIILISLDTVRADHLSVYGYERDTSPQLRKLAGQATLYRRAFATGNYTLPTHASMFTGLYPIRHGAHRYQEIPYHRPLERRFTTLAERLRAAGYLTLAVVANSIFLDQLSGLTQGFEYYDGRGESVPWQAPRGGKWTPRALLWSQENLNWLKRKLDPLAVRQRYRRAEAITREAVGLLERLKHRDTPFFLFLNYMDAHDPYLPPPPYDTRYGGLDTAFSWDDYHSRREALLLGSAVGLSTQAHAHVISQYDGALSYLDAQLGVLFSYLERQPWYDECLLIVTSDHGEAFGRKGLLAHGVSLYQNQIAIPMIIKYPRQKTAAVVDMLVSGVDVKPTVMDVAGLPMPSGLDGVSVALAESLDRRFVLSESYSLPAFVASFRSLNRDERAILHGAFKLIASSHDQFELFDVLNDPLELNDLADQDGAVSRDLKMRLSEWLQRVEPPRGLSERSPDQRERLEALGY
ncbi:MAG TPA: sulfatase [Acidobacteriota bacterium]